MHFIKPFLKWPGGKYRLLVHVLGSLPEASRLVEPFLGSGVVFLNSRFSSGLLCDSNEDLIRFFVTLQEGGSDFISFCSTFFCGRYNNKDDYFSLRDRFNTLPYCEERAAIFLYLNRHCYNGLVRYNSLGLFNVPFGRYSSPYFPRLELETYYKKIDDSQVEFRCCTFQESFSLGRAGDVFYCDPPYVELSKTSNFTSYDGSRFTDTMQRELAELAHTAYLSGIPVVLSNHDTPVSRGLYHAAKISNFSVRRFISCDASNRGFAPELLAVYA